ncbi:MAG: DUF692 domain-containing protein, partial [Burkholderiaceae bacterium]
RVGIGWRGELAAGIFANLDQIDILEVIADDYFNMEKRGLNALRRMSSLVPVTLHGVAMGLASTIPTEQVRIEKMARLVAAIRPESWSEHLAFVRAGGIQIGHLAAPPRSPQSVSGAIANIRTATRIVGTAPILENIATMIDPPASTLDEAQWVTEIVEGSDTTLLLDLHNLYANCVNFGKDPAEELLRFPLDRVRAVHLSGGKWVQEPGMHKPPRMRLLDDHLHDVPSEVFDLLTLLGQHAPRQLTVILERDGHYPNFDILLSQLSDARNALHRGRKLALPHQEYA